MIVLLAVGVGRVAVALSRHQDREQQPVRPRQHQPQGVQEGPEAGKKRKKDSHEQTPSKNEKNGDPETFF